MSPKPIRATDAPPRAKPTSYPEPFASRLAGRVKHPLGDLFGLMNFGVNLTRLSPGAMSALRHAHSRQDELVYVLSGQPTLITDAGSTELEPGMCVGFPAGTGEAHHLVNRTRVEVMLIEVGDRSAGDEVSYPEDDVKAVLGTDRQWTFAHKDNTPY
jgi:uncharacterized cupin superfamily protein